MTIVECILVIEIVIFAVLGIMLVMMLFNRNRGERAEGRIRHNLSCPAQNSCELYEMSRSQPDYNPAAYNAAPYSQYPQNSWNYYVNTRPGAPEMRSGGYFESSYNHSPGNAPAYYAHRYENAQIPSPVIGQERGNTLQRKRLTPADLSAMEGRTLRHIDIDQTGNYDNRKTIPYETQEPAFRNVESGRSKNAGRSVDHSGTMETFSGNLGKEERWKIDFVEMSSGREVTRDFQNTLVVGRQMPAPLESGRLYLSMDATVSRSQFCLFIENGRVMIENLSRVNITKKNGNPLWQPVSLEEGDILEMGRMRYLVKGISRAA